MRSFIPFFPRELLVAGLLTLFDFNSDRSSGLDGPVGGASSQCNPRSTGNSIEVKFTGATYRGASKGTSGSFRTGQSADILLSGYDFDNTGGPLLFNHLGGIASDGTRLALCDRFNNRILIWKNLPTSNVVPDLVLGQQDFYTNNPGSGLDQFDWPGSVRITPDGKVIVADTYNDRVLIWNSFPTRSRQAADIEIRPSDLIGPWGLWTDGQKLVVTSTWGGGKVLFWNTFPTQDNQAPSFISTANDQFGTPRTITSNGTYFIVGDHNAKTADGPQGNFVWKTFPANSDQPYDFFITDPLDRMYAWLQGDFTPDGKLVMLGRYLHLWNSPPRSAGDKPSLSMTRFPFDGGDGSDLVVAGGRIYVSMYNGNRVVVYNSMPTTSDQEPDFALGSPDICTNTLETNYFITNGVPASNGRQLIISSDFDRKMFLWRQLPDESRAFPDVQFFLPLGAWDNAIWGDTLALASQQTVYVWDKIPVNGELPRFTFSNRIGNVDFQEVRGVAVDARFFYLADTKANKVYVWEGLPAQISNPRFTLDVDQPRRLSSDGEYLVVTTTFAHSARVYSIATLALNAPPLGVIGGPGKFNLPEHAVVARGRLFVADTPFNRVHVWNDIRDAIAGKSADVLLGKENTNDRIPRIGKNQLFWPGAVAFDGFYVWVGEFKFSNRIVRFSPSVQTGITKQAGQPTSFALEQNYPNPFNSTTNFELRIANTGFVSLKVYDVLGKELATLLHEDYSPGIYTVSWNAGDWPSGIYFYQLQALGFIATRKLVLLK